MKIVFPKEFLKIVLTLCYSLFSFKFDIKFYPNNIANKISLFYQPGHSNPRNYLPNHRTSLGRTHKGKKHSNPRRSKTRKKRN